MHMEPSEIELPEMLLVGLEIETTQADLANTSSEAWAKAGELDLEMKIQNQKEPHVTLECQFNWHQDQNWIYMLAMEVTRFDNIPSEAAVREIPAASWLVFDLPGKIPNVDVVGSWNGIIEWFGANNRDIPFLAYIQRFDDKTGKAQNMIQL
jgi:predicted transcriptional regulator YdeE